MYDEQRANFLPNFVYWEVYHRVVYFSSMQHQKIVIVGAGFAGIRAALDLCCSPASEIVIISNNSDFEYYPGLHKIVGVSSRPTYRVALEKIFAGKPVSIIIDTVTAVDPQLKTVTMSSGTIAADVLILALGGQTDYFNIQGLRDTAYGFKSVAEAKRLRAHIEDLFEKHAKTEKTETVIGLHMVVVGAGPNGVDLAGEMAAFGKMLAKKHSIAESFLTIDLVEAGPRILGILPESVSHRVEQRLRILGVNVLCNRDLKKDESWTVTFADTTIGARTLVWTAGVTSNELVTKITGLSLGKRNRIAVDDFLQAKGFEDVYCVGDIADTPYAGLAQTALYDGTHVAKAILAKASGKNMKTYIPKKTAFNIGVGPKWSVMQVGSFVSYGIIPYIIRTLIDIKFFLSILPFDYVWNIYFGKKEKAN